ncbi:Ibr domain protein [Plasmodium coatneyi]|uniref:RBR-type E3 ubiquitin transferase n=1 Tax=Plasmodium coatneyi TaxID=208452 RepID=A0A1B1DZ16_9APIC|nr:Ibr domain protein [Plasmodium coatneyi]ANQ08008.1 Ibr domain protein [Plasmodium coatneyi]
MNIPKEDSLASRSIDVTIQLDRDRKMKVVKKVVRNVVKNVNSCDILMNQSGNYHSSERKETDESLNEGMKIYLQYFQRRMAKYRDTNIYEVYTLEQVEEKMKEAVTDVVSLTNLHYEYAYLFLKSYNFNSNDFIEAWFRNPKEVLTKAHMSHLREEDLCADYANGETAPPVVAPTTDMTISTEEFPSEKVAQTERGTKYTCPILLNEYDLQDTHALKCGHRYSKQCWRGYLQTAIDNEFYENIITKKCIEPKCQEIIMREDWKNISHPSNDLLAQYEKILLKIFIKSNPSLKKCPRDKCAYVIESVMLPDNGVICKCGYNFCFNCTEEFHRPVTCSVIKQWNDLLTKGEHNIKWIRSHTKQCPNCAKAIEKTSGCMNVKCICGFSFCWLCLQPWAHHKGGFYQCNQYVTRRGALNGAQDDLQHDATDDANEMSKDTPDEAPTLTPQSRKSAHEALHKFSHFKTRFDAHQHGEEFSIKTQLLFLSQFCTSNNIEPTHRIHHFEDSIIQTIRCRKMLKWSYAFAYFATWEDENKKYLFEYHQGQLEKNLDILQKKTESVNLAHFLTTNLDVKVVREVEELTNTVDVFFKNICDFMESTFSSCAEKRLG